MATTLAVSVVLGAATTARAQEAAPPDRFGTLEEDAYYLPRRAADPGGDAAGATAAAPAIGGLILTGLGWWPLALDSSISDARAFIGPTLGLHVFLGAPEPGWRLFLGGTIGVAQAQFDEEDAAGTRIYDHASMFIRSGGFAGVELWGDSPIDPYVIGVAGLLIENRNSRAQVVAPGVVDAKDQFVGGFLELRLGCMYRTGYFYLDAHLDVAWLPGNDFFPLALGISLGIGLVL